MPHQCTDCGRQFDDGSKEMLSGCPNCGGNKFQYLPASAAESSQESTIDPHSTDSSVARTVGDAASAVRDFVGGSSEPASADTATRSNSPERGSTVDGQSEPTAVDESGVRSDTPGNKAAVEAAGNRTTIEDDAQASARSELVSPDELPSTSDRTGWDRTTPGPGPRTGNSDSERGASEHSPDSERPDLSELRAELNEQFESIKVVEPGQYELNLMELFDRQEYIIALQEDGKYTVQVPEHWQE